MKVTRALPLALALVLVTGASAKALTYTRAVLPEDHFLWDYFPPSARNDGLVIDNHGCYYLYAEGAVHLITDIEETQICQDSSGNFGTYADPIPRY